MVFLILVLLCFDRSLFSSALSICEHNLIGDHILIGSAFGHGPRPHDALLGFVVVGGRANGVGGISVGPGTVPCTGELQV